MGSVGMQRLRGFLRGCFGYLTLISTFASGLALITFYRLALGHSNLIPSHSTGRSTLLSVLLMVLSLSIRCMPLVMAVTYGMAWWTLKQGKPSARPWAVAASALLIIVSVILITARFSIWGHGRSHHLGSFLFFQSLFIAAGILGLFVFVRTSSAEIIARAAPPRIQGDGTSAFLDIAVSLMALAGLWGGMIVYTRWGQAQHLPIIRGSISATLVVAVILITIALHEAAHAGVGLALGMKVRAIVIGPFQLRIRDGQWTHRFSIASFLSFGGSTGLIPSNPDQSRWVEICMIAAGPLINLCAGLAASWAAFGAKGRTYERYWELIAFFATVNLITFIVNLIPFRPDAIYSDGARIYQLVSGGPWACLHRVYSTVLSSTVTPLRPKNYNLSAIEQAACFFTHGREALMLRIFATSYFLDTGGPLLAHEAFVEAERIQRESRVPLSPELLLTFVFNSVYLANDGAAARRFWDVFESTNPTYFGVDYWLSRTALHWIENHLAEAQDSWKTGYALARKLPDAGAYNFDRDRYDMMRQLLDGTPIAVNGGISSQLVDQPSTVVLVAARTVHS